VRLRRKRERGSHERETIDAILDEALIAHLGIADEAGQPFVIPTLHARSGDTVYLHGSTASRALRALCNGAPACLTVSLLDGLVLARAVMHHSANYRSVMLLGKARIVESPQEKLAAMEAVVALPIDEASAKIRSGPPQDDEDDYALPVWAGVIPLVTEARAPESDPRLSAAIAAPSSATDYRRPGSPRT